MAEGIIKPVGEGAVYPSLDEFWADLVAAYQQELHALYDAGCRYVQIDETSLVKLGDPRARQLLKERGDDWQDLLKTYVDVINRAVAGAPADMHIAIHVCRSQDPSWQADVGYDPIAAEEAGKLLKGVSLAGSVADAVEGADAVVLVTEWREFKELDLAAVASAMRGNVFIDGRNLLDGDAARRAGLVYEGIGRGYAHQVDLVPAPGSRSV